VQIYLLAERTGWTLDYIRSLDLDDFFNMREILRGLDTARYHQSRRTLGE